MKTLKKDGRTLKPEDIYLDLSKLSEEEIKSIPKVLEKAGEKMSTNVETFLLQDIDNEYNCVAISNEKWYLKSAFGLKDFTEITYPDFLKLFGESELTELPEKWFIRGSNEMSEYFEENGITMKGNVDSFGYHIDYIDEWGYNHLEYLSDHTEITVADYKRLSVSAENAHTENHLVDALKMYVDLGEEKLEDTLIKDAKKRLEKHGWFVFPKAPEGEFPDLTGLQGEYLHGAVDPDGRGYPTNILFKHEYSERPYHPYVDVNGNSFCSVRPIQKPKPTLQDLWKLERKQERI